MQEIDEVRVDEAIDAILEPDAAPVPGGEARTEVMGELFVAADRLIHDPSDPEGRQAIEAGADEAATHAPPYGMDRAWWTGLGDQLRAFSSLLAVSGARHRPGGGRRRHRAPRRAPPIRLGARRPVRFPS